jgi:lipopolysaccharide/colanic/teichoic acid biosynthesis glycosyltransferase
MRRLVLLIVDVALLLLATLIALFLRENFEVAPGRLAAFLPYLLATFVTALAVFPIAGLNRSVWRFSGLHDHLAVTAAVAVAIACAVGLGFAYDRLGGVARSLPFLQFLAGTAFLSGARALHRLAHELSYGRKASATLLKPALEEGREKTVLIVGISRLAEAYFLAAAEMASGRIKVVGLVGRSERHAGRLIGAQPVFGRPEDLASILDTLEVHGIAVDCIAVATSFGSLSKEAQEALLLAESARSIELRFLAEDWGLGFERPVPAGASVQRRSNAPAEGEAKPQFEISPAQLAGIAQRRYWTVKRLIDFIGASALLLLLSPLMLLTICLAMASTGSPVLFWQYRPGLGGRPFRLYKLRTMRAAHAFDGRRLRDCERVSKVGKVLRRLRLDELPQLVNILRGDMSFIGPRPLLPQDQSKACRARLLVRPGLSGWAQVIGGRDIAPVDKAALDVWYMCNASLALDVEIALRTILIVVFGERVSARLIARAWHELGETGILAGQFALQD